MKRIASNLAPVAFIVLLLFAFWYVMAVVLNTPWAEDKAKRAGVELSFSELVADTWAQKKPRLPAPHQIGAEIWKTTVLKKITSKRSLIFHARITLSATLLGFVFGTAFGILLAISIVHIRAMDMSVMPWVIASQTIPILAIAPMIVVVLSAIGISGLIPKAVISMYLSFFPVVVGMVKGLRSPETMQLDLMRTYNSSGRQSFWKLRWPSSVPYLFTSLKVAVAASLIGAIVGELPISQDGGLGARMLVGSYYGTTLMIWSALIVAATLAATLVGIVGIAQAAVTRRMGFVQ